MDLDIENCAVQRTLQTSVTDFQNGLFSKWLFLQIELFIYYIMFLTQSGAAVKVIILRVDKRASPRFIKYL